MPDDKETASERAQLTRIFEASCKIDYPTKEESNFRLALMKKLGLAFRLSEVRTLTITGPSTADTKRPSGR